VETPSSKISNIETTTTTSSSDLVGLTIQGWNIATSQGPIGDQHWFEKAQHALEPLAQFRGEKTNNKGRKLVLPEMVFPLAHIVLEYNGPTAEDRDKEQENGDDVFMVWDAMDALQEWSRAHQGIPMPQVKNDTSFTSSPFVSCRGVGVLESSDASLWKQKQSQSAGTDNNKNDSSGAIRNTEFHYDWTYSTPFCGSIFVSGQPVQSQHSFIRWQPLPKSGMPMSLLTDTSVPILYYDQILLYEDDLHDNGAVEYSIKVRVMPHCVYILGRLFVRVDHVLVRLRETRWLVELESSKNVLFSQNENKSATIYRDVTWREAAWKDLGPKYGLPSQLSAWTTDSSTREAQAFQGLLAKLPLVDLPHEVPQHAKLVYSCVFE
jgi:type 2A phosphatase activator TIP41